MQRSQSGLNFAIPTCHETTIAILCTGVLRPIIMREYPPIQIDRFYYSDLVSISATSGFSRYICFSEIT